MSEVTVMTALKDVAAGQVVSTDDVGPLNTSGITPYDLLALVLPDPVKEQTEGGIYIPQTAQEREKYNTQKATIIALGKSCHVQWVEKPQPGDRVIIAQYAGKMMEGRDGKDYRIIKEDDLLAGWED